jgi:hypothetical protein
MEAIDARFTIDQLLPPSFIPDIEFDKCRLRSDLACNARSVRSVDIA